MSDWIKKNLVLYALINLSLCLLVGFLVLKGYVDYRVDKENEKIEQQLNVIESSTDTILEILKDYDKNN